MASAPSVAAVVATPAPTLQLTFQEEFNGSSLRSVWGRHWPGFGAAVWSRAKSVVGSGVLKITATNAGQSWTSDLVDTVGTFEQQYGLFIARIKYPQAAGLWPAFWLAQPPNAKGQLGEIDIVEACAGPPGSNGGNDITVMNVYVHDLAGRTAFAARRVPAPHTANVWHTYKLEWRPGRIRFFRDGVVIARLTDASKIPDVKMAIVLDLAGGGYCGPATSATPTNATMVIDWVRAYR